MSRFPRLITAAALLATIACSGATECSCVAPSTTIEVFGTVTAAGAPLSGAVVEVRVAPGQCEADAALSSDIGTTQTASDGRYTATVGTTRTGAACLHVRAIKFDAPQATTTRRIDTTLPATLGGGQPRVQADVAVQVE